MTHTVKAAIESAAIWLGQRRGERPGYRGAFVAGSVARLEEEAILPAGSDVDVMVVAAADGYLGKEVVGGIVIEGTVLAARTVLDPEQVLRDYHLAPGVVHARILEDPDGAIERVRAAVRGRYADRDTIRARLDHVEARVRATLTSAGSDRSEAERVNAWLFGVGQLAHMILVAGLENPTIRTRYVRAGEVLARHGEEVVYARLLRLAGMSAMQRPAVEAITRDLGDLLDRAGPVAARSAWRFASDIAPQMRQVVMKGIETMIGGGWYREAMFPIAMTWCRCAQIMEKEAPAALPVDTMPRLREALRVASDDDLCEAVAEGMEAIPGLRAVGERIAMA